nr:hypothetical protein [uncultured Allomuricauda sp.]
MRKARLLIEEAKNDFEKEFFYNRVYVEALRQIHEEDLEELSKSIGD